VTDLTLLTQRLFEDRVASSVKRIDPDKGVARPDPHVLRLINLSGEM
jgi:hypothetical protein